MSRESRCTGWKHVLENGTRVCDCGQLVVFPTVARNAQVINVLRVTAAYDKARATGEAEGE